LRWAQDLLPSANVAFFRLGIEGLVMFQREIQFDADNYTITVPTSSANAVISVFDKVKVNIEVEKDKNTQRGRVKMTLVHPVDSGSL
jgi:exosome complex exonuclease DIS3/RRP44